MFAFLGCFWGPTPLRESPASPANSPDSRNATHFYGGPSLAELAFGADVSGSSADAGILSPRGPTPLRESPASPANAPDPRNATHFYGGPSLAELAFGADASGSSADAGILSPRAPSAISGISNMSRISSAVPGHRRWHAVEFDSESERSAFSRRRVDSPRSRTIIGPLPSQEFDSTVQRRLFQWYVLPDVPVDVPPAQAVGNFSPASSLNRGGGGTLPYVRPGTEAWEQQQARIAAVQARIDAQEARFQGFGRSQGSAVHHGQPLAADYVLRAPRIAMTDAHGLWLGSFLLRDYAARLQQVHAGVAASSASEGVAAAVLDGALHDCAEKELCAICMDEFRAGQRLQPMADCPHVFHEDCARSYLNRLWPCKAMLRCPVCRGPFVWKRAVAAPTMAELDVRACEEHSGAERDYPAAVTVHRALEKCHMREVVAEPGDVEGGDDGECSVDVPSPKLDLGEFGSLPICNVWPRGFYRRSSTSPDCDDSPLSNQGGRHPRNATAPPVGFGDLSEDGE